MVRVYSHLGVEQGSRMLELASWSTGTERCTERSGELPRNGMGFETSKLFTPTPWYTSSNFPILLKQFHQLGIKCSNICAYREGFFIQIVTPPNVWRTGRWGLFQPIAGHLLRKDTTSVWRSSLEQPKQNGFRGDARKRRKSNREPASLLPGCLSVTLPFQNLFVLLQQQRYGMAYILADSHAIYFRIKEPSWGRSRKTCHQAANSAVLEPKVPTVELCGDNTESIREIV